MRCAEYLLAACKQDLRRHDLAYGMQARPGQQLSTRTPMCGASPLGARSVANRKFKKAFHGLVGTSLRLAYGGDPVPNFPSYRRAV